MSHKEMVGAICEVCGIDWKEVPKSSMSFLGKVARELMDVNATPDEVRRKAEVYFQKFDFGEGPAELTPGALLKHWASLKPKQEDRVQMAHRLAKENGLERFKGAPYETIEMFVERVERSLSNVVRIA